MLFGQLQSASSPPIDSANIAAIKVTNKCQTAKSNVSFSILILLDLCYGLNVCIPWNSYVETLMSNGMLLGSGAFGRCLAHEGGSLMNRNSSPIKRGSQSSLAPSTAWGYSKKSVVHDLEKGCVKNYINEVTLKRSQSCHPRGNTLHVTNPWKVKTG